MTGQHGVPATLRELVEAYLAEQCSVVLEGEAPLRAGENVIHRTRVGVRRLRSTLRVFDELFEQPRSARLDEELRWWAGVLGQVRDLDVMEQRLTRHLDALPDELVLGPVRADLAELVAGRRRRATDALAEALDSDRYAALRALLEGWRSSAPFTAAADRKAAKVASFLKRADRKVTRRLAQAQEAFRAGDPAAEDLLHRARKAGKRHRYAAEAAEPLWGARARAVVERRKVLQELLGDFQDSVVAMDFLRELGTGGAGAGSNGFTWGVLYGAEQASRARVVDELGDARG